MTRWGAFWILTVLTLSGWSLFLILALSPRPHDGYHRWHYRCVAEEGNRDTLLTVNAARLRCYWRERAIQRRNEWADSLRGTP